MTDKLNLDTYCSNAFGGFDSWAGAICCKIISQNKNVSFDTIINSEVSKQIQHDLLNGIKNPLCDDCWTQERRGVKSLRYHSTFAQLRGPEADNYSHASIIKEEVTNKKIRHLTIDSGNMCNLACRTCHPSLSSGLWKESEYKNNSKKFPEIYYKSSVIKTNLALLMQEDYSAIEHVRILGGEPFLNLDHLCVLEKIIQDGNAGNCVLSYTSNGTTKLPSKIKSILSNFRHTSIMLSIDAIDDQFHYIRTTGNWQDVLENIEDLLLETKNNIYISINSAISVLNLFYIEEVYKLHASLGGDMELQFVTEPNHYSTNILRDHEKNVIIKQLEQSNFDCNSIIQYVRESDYDPMARQRFYDEIAFTKEFRGLDINDYLPRLMSTLGGNYCYES